MTLQKTFSIKRRITGKHAFPLVEFRKTAVVLRAFCVSLLLGRSQGHASLRSAYENVIPDSICARILTRAVRLRQVPKERWLCRQAPPGVRLHAA